jgi:YesN/AraC family two-component response regulator
MKMANILLVEDEQLVRETLSRAMESKGHMVVTAANGEEGLTKFSEGPFDLVVTDIIMPDMEGIGMILEMRRKTPDAKIVAISGGGRTGNIDFLKAAKYLGAAEVLKKPIPLADLFRAIDNCMSTKTPV